MANLLHQIRGALEGRSPEWYAFRLQVIEELKERGQWFCPVCLTKKKLELHHVIPVSVDRSKERDRGNIRVLCKRHHFLIGHLENWHHYNIDVDADIAYWAARLHGVPNMQNFLTDNIPKNISILS